MKFLQLVVWRKGDAGPCNQLHGQYALEVGDEPYENAAHVVPQDMTAEPKPNNRR